ncbi:hypothetical protein FHR19_002537 [Sphingomonas yantingensis]|uniref:Uncharacterized protein n=1 Tax=Sphingomonas yantingensis TaxID=1241761 RepID=A0A7W9ARC9_9SPHN|nr:hypothetical protein [Sphingomonas yantingensis]
MPIGAKLHYQRREVRIARGDAERVQFLSIKQLHRIDDQSDVGRVLALRIAELLDRPNGMLVQFASPALQTRASPVAVRPPNIGDPIFRKLGEHGGDFAMRHVIRVDQQRNASVLRPGHEGGTIMPDSLSRSVTEVEQDNQNAERPTFGRSNAFARNPKPAIRSSPKRVSIKSV